MYGHAHYRYGHHAPDISTMNLVAEFSRGLIAGFNAGTPLTTATVSTARLGRGSGFRGNYTDFCRKINISLADYWM
jgi:hypothetical protein